MNSLEEIALKVAQETNAYFDMYDEKTKEDWLLEYSSRLVAALGAQEPVAYVRTDHLDKAKIAPFLCSVVPAAESPDYTKLFAAPVLPSVPEGWQWVPKKATPEMWLAIDSATEVEDAEADCHQIWSAMLAAAPSPQEDK